MTFHEEISPAYLTSKPADREREANKFISGLAKKRDKEVMDAQSWDCWNCSNKAVSLIHTPINYLHRARPQVVDIALPICERQGKCDMEGRRFMVEEMDDMARGRRGMHA